ncbi:type IV toxin-antitoxin system AbiEi family antitoxin domain-containing protein [Pseudonocardia nematodicida]|uniref:Type IV toxin-antitoxin system AbiEi family antitoxin domain-containing protein n=1 Tax=Pseudonocardia nematodicida TaxID=1206997 RepID=A0ABV1KK86_9PSEU
MRFDDVLKAQDGVISRRQAIACGVSPWMLRARVASGALAEVAPGVFRSAAHRRTAWGAVVVATLWAGRGAVVDGPAAAHLHGMPVPAQARRVVGITIPVSSRRKAPAGIRVRRRDLDPLDRGVCRGVAVTAPALSALETAVALPDGAAFLDRVLQRELVAFEDLLAAFRRAVGSHGSARARELIVEAADRADSRAERRLVTLLRRKGIDGFELGLAFERWFIDIAFVRARLAVEIDGWAFHSDPDRFRNDRHKQNALVAAKWTVLRFTWQDIRDRPDDTARRIQRALRA